MSFFPCLFDILGSTGRLRRGAFFLEACHLLSQALEHRSCDYLQTMAARHRSPRWAVVTLRHVDIQEAIHTFSLYNQLFKFCFLLSPPIFCKLELVYFKQWKKTNKLVDYRLKTSCGRSKLEIHIFLVLSHCPITIWSKLTWLQYFFFHSAHIFLLKTHSDENGILGVFTCPCSLFLMMGACSHVKKLGHPH